MALIFDPPEINYFDPQPFYPPDTAGQILHSAIESIEMGQPIIMREICRQLNLTPGAPYSHYESAEHLESVITYTGLLTLAKWMADSTRELSNPRERLVASCRAYRTWAHQHRSWFGFILPTAGRTNESPFMKHVQSASLAIAIPAARALRDGWDNGTFISPATGPAVFPLDIPGVVSLNADETRTANTLWIMAHGAISVELTIGIHDGWQSETPMFDWLLESHINTYIAQRT